MVNSDLKLIRHREEYKEKGYTVLYNFFQQQYLDEGYDVLTSFPQSYWFHAVGDAAGVSNALLYIKEETEQGRKEIYEKALLAHKSGSLAFSYKSTPVNHRSASEPFKLSRIFNTDYIKQVISFVTDQDISVLNSLQVLKYSEGDFLVAWNPTPQTTVGFIYNMTKDWQVEYGGLLSFYSEPDKSVLLADINVANSLILYNVKRFSTCKKVISRVHIGSDINSRYSLEGTYDSKSTFLEKNTIRDEREV